MGLFLAININFFGNFGDMLLIIGSLIISGSAIILSCLIFGFLLWRSLRQTDDEDDASSQGTNDSNTKKDDDNGNGNGNTISAQEALGDVLA